MFLQIVAGLVGLSALLLAIYVIDRVTVRGYVNAKERLGIELVRSARKSRERHAEIAAQQARMLEEI